MVINKTTCILISLLTLTLICLGCNILDVITLPTMLGEDPDLVAYYPFECNAYDLSGNDNHGEITGGFKWVAGKFGDAIELDPTAYVEIEASDSLHGALFKSEPFTICAWVNPSFDGSAWQQIWTSLPRDAGFDALSININNGVISWRGRAGAFTGRGIYTVLCQTEGGIVEADKWIHIAVRSDRNTFKIYANGNRVAEYDFDKTYGANATYRIGGFENPRQTFAGLMDDFAVFSRALDEDEINLIMEEGVEAFLNRN